MKGRKLMLQWEQKTLKEYNDKPVFIAKAKVKHVDIFYMVGELLSGWFVWANGRECYNVIFESSEKAQEAAQKHYNSLILSGIGAEDEPLWCSCGDGINQYDIDNSAATTERCVNCFMFDELQREGGGEA